MKGLLLLLFPFLLFNAHSQIVEHDWTRSFYSGGSAYTHTNGVAVTDLGYAYSIHSFKNTCFAESSWSTYYSIGEEDIMISKTSDTRTAMWEKQIGGPGVDYPDAIEQMSNGDLIITGIFSDSMDFDPGVGQEWRLSNGDVDNFILRLDENGNYINCCTFGGSGYSYINDLIITENDEVFVCGWFLDSMNLSPNTQQSETLVSENGYKSFISKFDSNLNYVSTTVFGTNAVIVDLFLSEENTILYAGYFEDSLFSSFIDYNEVFVSKSNRDAFYGECDLMFHNLMQKTVGSENDELGWFISQLSNGTKVLQLNFDESFSIQNGAEELHVWPAHTNTFVSSSLQNSVILCVTDETVEWHQVFSGFGTNGRAFPQTELVTDDKGNLIASFYFMGGCDLNELGVNPITDNSNRGSFVIKMSESGAIHWIRRLNGWGDNSFASITAMHLEGDDLYIGGSFSGTLDFDPSIQEYFESGSTDPYLTKWVLHDQHLEAPVVTISKPENLSPNPANHFLILKSPEVKDIVVHDISGKMIPMDYSFNGEQYQINTSEFENGVYVLSYQKDGSTHSKRFVVQH